MKQIIIWTLVSGLLFISFLALLIIGLVRKKRTNLLFSIAFLLLTFIGGFYVLYLVATKSANRISAMGKPRTGIEIYTALFDRPAYGCVEVMNKMDQTVPRLDCCIWLEFKTCPIELNRIINRESLVPPIYQYSDTSAFIPNYSPRPVWWNPHLLGDSVVVLQKYDPDDPNHDQILIFSRDSTHAFYCDMAD
jgi:hypothetical protein